jgi:hypothetical protein
LREREQNDTTTKAHNESQEKYEELLKKFIDVDRKIDLLQGTIERYVICFSHWGLVGGCMSRAYSYEILMLYSIPSIQAWRKYNSKGFSVSIRET